MCNFCLVYFSVYLQIRLIFVILLKFSVDDAQRFAAPCERIDCPVDLFVAVGGRDLDPNSSFALKIKKITQQKF